MTSATGPTMPIHHRIDHARRLVIAEGLGEVTDQDIFGYQRDVWSRPDVTGYHELVDMSAITSLPTPPEAGRMRDLASLSAKTDVPHPGARLAIVAGNDLAYGLAQMYAAYRSINPQSTKQVEVFRSLDDALRWLVPKTP